ncbi:MAG: SDR family oxidoreductase [Rhodospirillales bacterium]|nr:SDR family oxidoreductase [Rhodospirillales bacterium]
METDMKGRVVVITGGASGIGEACAELFYNEGARVVVVDKQAPQTSHKDLVLEGDVGDEKTVQAHVNAILENYGRIDSLVTCAGFSTGKSVTETSLDDWNAVLQTNLTGTFLWARETAITMSKTGGGTIVMIGSQLAFAGGKSNAAYLASKGGIVSLAQTMAIDCAVDNIRVNALIPGAIETPLLSRSFARADDPDVARVRSISRHPLGRLGQPSEMARAILFLASPASSFTTGSCLRADGGWLAG